MLEVVSRWKKTHTASHANQKKEHKKQERSTTNLMKAEFSMDETIRVAIVGHIKHFWPQSIVTEEKWEKGPIQHSLPGFRILKVAPSAPTLPVVYVTNGCFQKDLGKHLLHEFFIIAPTQNRQHIETLTMLANFDADDNYRLEVGSTVSIGDSWLPGSLCDHLLISIPYPYGPQLEWLRLSNVCIRFLWVLPITGREAGFVELNGLEALETQFDKMTLDYLNPNRLSVI